MNDNYSFQTGEKGEFDALDYVLFSLLFLASAAIGFYHAYKDRNSTDVDDFHLGGRAMHPVPVSLSLTATFMSALMILGTPAEIYTNGTMFFWIGSAMFVATAGTAHVFLPIFYRMNVTSCFEYLRIRFGTLTKVIACTLFLIQTLLYMGLVLYAPSLAFEVVTGLSLWGSLITVSVVCTLYTTLGGMKTVLWTDSLQFVVMVGGLLALLIKGTAESGGIEKVIRTANERGRIEFFNISPNPHTRHSIWSLCIGGGLFWSYLYGVNQSQVQRECSTPTLFKAKVALWLNFPGLLLMVGLTCFLGIIMYGFYSDCDPVKFGLLDKNDQIIPLMVLDVLGPIPGLPGIFMACVFSGSLSSISSGLNAMSAVIVEDYIKVFCWKTISDKNDVILSKGIVVLIGFAMFAMALIIAQASGLIVQFAYTLYSIISGPLLGCFVAGMIFPWTNKYGSVSGLITSFILMCWLGIGSLTHEPQSQQPLPVLTHGCNWNATNPDKNITSPTNASHFETTAYNSSDSVSEESLLDPFYGMSYQWYTGFGMLITISVALIVSLITGPTDPKSIDSKLMCPLFYEMCPFLPEKIRHYLRFGVAYKKTVEENEQSVPMVSKGDQKQDKNSIAF